MKIRRYYVGTEEVTFIKDLGAGDALFRRADGTRVAVKRGQWRFVDEEHVSNDNEDFDEGEGNDEDE